MRESIQIVNFSFQQLSIKIMLYNTAQMNKNGQRKDEVVIRLWESEREEVGEKRRDSERERKRERESATPKAMAKKKTPLDDKKWKETKRAIAYAYKNKK